MDFILCTVRVQYIQMGKRMMGIVSRYRNPLFFKQNFQLNNKSLDSAPESNYEHP